MKKKSNFRIFLIVVFVILALLLLCFGFPILFLCFMNIGYFIITVTILLLVVFLLLLMIYQKKIYLILTVLNLLLILSFAIVFEPPIKVSVKNIFNHKPISGVKITLERTITSQKHINVPLPIAGGGSSYIDEKEEKTCITDEKGICKFNAYFKLIMPFVSFAKETIRIERPDVADIYSDYLQPYYATMPWNLNQKPVTYYNDTILFGSPLVPKIDFWPDHIRYKLLPLIQVNLNSNDLFENCKQLKDDKMVFDCKVLNAIYIASMTKDPKYCCYDNFLSKAEIELYHKEYGKTFVTSLGSMCDEMCFGPVAAYLKDISVCEPLLKIQSNKKWLGVFYRNSCIQTAAERNNDPSFCEAIKKPED
ncbi:hypothetical protein KJ708_11945, partial [bacterium]|nr:hypothetical protein [bacterium]